MVHILSVDCCSDPRILRNKYCTFCKELNKRQCAFPLGRYFVYFFDLVIFANAVFIALERNDAEVLFLGLFNLEIALKLYTYGFKGFFSRYWNM